MYFNPCILTRAMFISLYILQHITDETVCLCISDGSLLPLIAARLGAKHVS